MVTIRAKLMFSEASFVGADGAAAQRGLLWGFRGATKPLGRFRACGAPSSQPAAARLFGYVFDHFFDFFRVQKESLFCVKTT